MRVAERYVFGFRERLMHSMRWMLMPGFNLFTRRRVRLCRHWNRGPRRVLDAGSGNGWFSYLAYDSGATVVGVNMAEDQVEKARRFYNAWKGISEERLSFELLNLYQIGSLEAGFDEIICYETLEHIRDDRKICQFFWGLLKEDGVLHLCCPNAEHPRWRTEPLDLEEKGYHVRAGYTLKSYRELLEPIGFEILDAEDVGGKWLTGAAQWINEGRYRRSALLNLLLTFSAFPLIWMDPARLDCPYCIYVKAVKRRVSA